MDYRIILNVQLCNFFRISIETFFDCSTSYQGGQSVHLRYMKLFLENKLKEIILDSSFSFGSMQMSSEEIHFLIFFGKDAFSKHI